jgi:phage pi2 protein 07
MDILLENEIKRTLNYMISEQSEIETDNAPKDATDSLFTPAEEKFLGKFDAYGTEHLGIIYSVSDIGIREFISRSGKEFNLTPGILLNLLRNKVIKIVPYTGWGRNNDYTIELQLSLDDVKGLGAADKAKAEKASGASGAPAGGGPGELPMPAGGPAPEVAWVVKYGDILRESVKITKQLITEKKSTAKSVEIPADKTRVLKRLPKEYITHMERVIKMMDKKTKTTHEKERLIADVLDVLQMSLKLTPKEIRKSFDFHKSQKRLQKYLKN